MSDVLLEVKNLHTTFDTMDGAVPAVCGVSLEINRGEVLALVGESGCGKSVTSLSIMRLIPCPPGRISADKISFDGVDLLGLSNDEMRKVRGNTMAMIFQEPMTSLNPVMTIGAQLCEPLETHRGMSRLEAAEESVRMLKLAGVSLPEQRMHEYPHQLSGGMRQRVMIAMALTCRPKLLIADEPTTALDVTIQAQILELMKELRRELGMSMMLITHDMGVVREMSDRVAIMYAGQIVEQGPVKEIFQNPLHPYTYGLLGSIPPINRKAETLRVIRGVVPSPMFFPSGCRFHPRCDYATAECSDQMPELMEVGGDSRLVRCWHPLIEKGGANRD